MMLLERLEGGSQPDFAAAARLRLDEFSSRVAGARQVLHSWPRCDTDSGLEVRQFELLPFLLIQVVSWDFYELIRHLRAECRMQLDREDVREVAGHVAHKLAVAAGMPPGDIQFFGEGDPFNETNSELRDPNRGFPMGSSQVNPRTFIVGPPQHRLRRNAIVDPCPGGGVG